MRYAERPSVSRYLPVFFSMALGLAAKPMLVTLPFVLLLLDYWPLRRLGLGAPPRGKFPAADGDNPLPRPRLYVVLIEKAPLLALAAASCIVTWIVQAHGGAMASIVKLPLAARLANVPVAYVVYLWKMVCPQDLAVYYPYPLSRPLWEPVAAAAALAAITALVIWQVRRRPYLAVGWFWFLGTLVPVIGLVQVGGQAMADRYTYIPMIGVFLMLVWGAADLLAAWPRRRLVLAPMAAAAVVLCMVLARGQVACWADSAALFDRDMNVAGESDLAWTNLGDAYLSAGRTDDAVAAFRAALRLNPRYAIAHNNLGMVLLRQGDPARAVLCFRDALASNPDYAIGHNNMGVAPMRLDRLEEAADEYRAALRLRPDFAHAHSNLAQVLLRQKAYDEADRELSEAIRLDRRYARPHNTRGLMRMEQGRPAEAAVEFREAIRLEPGNAQMRLNLGKALLAQGRTQEAQAEFRAALAIDPSLDAALLPDN